MNNIESKKKEYYTVDLLHIVKSVFRRLWAIILSATVAAAIGFCMAVFLIAPKFSSSIMLYVNNSSFSLGNTSFSISSSEIIAAQSLVKTYIVMLENRTTLEEVIDRTGVDYSYEEMLGMIKAEAVNETEVLRITVTSEDAHEAAEIANCIAEVLPNRIAEIIEGSSMEIVDSGVVNTNKVSPSTTKYTIFGFLIGGFISTFILVIFAILDDTVHDEEYILNNYEYPILAKVPDLVNSGTRPYSYYYQSKKKGN